MCSPHSPPDATVKRVRRFGPKNHKVRMYQAKILEQPTCALDGRGEKEREEHDGGPRPGPSQEDDVEGEAL